MRRLERHQSAYCRFMPVQTIRKKDVEIMKEITWLTMLICIIIVTVLAAWLITLCKHALTGMFCACAAAAGNYYICCYASYIVSAVAWGIRFAIVFAIVAFVLGIFPRKKVYQQAG